MVSYENLLIRYCRYEKRKNIEIESSISISQGADSGCKERWAGKLNFVFF